MYEFYKDDNICFRIEQVRGKLFAHVDIKHWSKSTFQLCSIIWEDFKEQCIKLGYNNMYSIIPKDSKILKFNMLFGATIIEETEEHLFLEFKLEN